MVTEDAFCFDAAFRALTGNEPFPWQRELFERLLQGNIPSSCDIPTGLGKTAVVTVWLIALTKCPEKIPRRLVYVVNRRTVVDQTTNEAMKLRDNAPKIGIENFAISTLRGQYADNGEWSADPSRPAIIVGTVDMIGSRLLFSGYHIGFKSRPLHAGFLGQDALLVHDEAHLEPAFQKLIDRIVDEQREYEGTHELPWPKLRVMALTATRRGSDQDGAVLKLDKHDQEHPVVRSRVSARKSLRLHPCDEGKKLVDRIVKLALDRKESGDAILVFVRHVADALSVLDRLEDRKNGCPGHVAPLTGTMRGKERDDLVCKNPVFARFMPAAYRDEGVKPVEGTAYLVCTSAGEVGVNLSADHMVCDLSTLDSVIQRLGRVNRFGTREDTCVDVVHPESFDDKPPNPQRRATLDLLRQLPVVDEGVYDASPKALKELQGRTDLPCKVSDAFSPTPPMLDATDILFDAWAMTTIRDQMPGRPPVAPYLHGVAEWDPPVTHIAWRDEVGIITGDLLDHYPPEDLLEDYPLKPHELLRDRSDRVFDKLEALATRHPNAPVWVVDEQGKVTNWPLGKLADPSATRASAKEPLIKGIDGRTILLPPFVGGLSRGMLDAQSDHADDVADIEAPATERRMRLWSDDERYDEQTVGMRLVRSIDLNEDDDEEQRTWDWYKHKPLEDARTAQRPVRWDIHVGDAVRRIDHILAGLSLPEEIAHAVRVAVKLHDHGKRRPQFQHALGNRAYPQLVLAKSGRTGAKLPETCRHEFGSMADALEDAEFQKLSPEMQDLVLHLIAAHHGRARPHFQVVEALDPVPGRTQADADRLASEVPRRFARLQRRYGRWGLAYLESLLRAADWAASAEPSEFVTETKKVLQ